MMPLSNDLRERILAAVDNCEGSRRQIAARFCVNVSTITRLLQLRHQTGSLDPRPHGGGKPPTLDHDGLERLRTVVRERADLARSVTPQSQRKSMILGEACGSSTSPAKKRPNMPTRRPTRCPGNSPLVRRKVKAIEPQRLVFIDETGVTTAMTPAYARAPRGERAVGLGPGIVESVTVTAAIGLEGVRAPLVFPGATNEAAFQTYVDRVLVPALHQEMSWCSTTWPLT